MFPKLEYGSALQEVAVEVDELTYEATDEETVDVETEETWFVSETCVSRDTDPLGKK